MGDASLSVVDSIIKKLLIVQDKPTQTEVTDITTDEVMLLCRKIRTVHHAAYAYVSVDQRRPLRLPVRHACQQGGTTSHPNIAPLS